MKKITLLLLLIPIFTFSQDVWNFDTTAENWDDNDFRCVTTHNTGEITVSFVADVKNPYIENQNLGITKDDALAFPIIAVTLKQNNYLTGPGQIRVTYPKDAEGGSNTNALNLNSTDNNFHTYYIDISGDYWGADGTTEETQLKIAFKAENNGNFFAPDNSSIVIEQIEFLSEIPLPEKLDYNFDTPSDDEGWVTNSNGTPTIDSGEVSVDYITITPESNKMVKLDNNSYNVDASYNNYLYVLYKNIPEAAGDGVYNDVFRLQYKTSTNGYSGNSSMTVALTENMSATDAFAIAKFDLTGEANWDGTTKDFQISIKNAVFQAAQDPVWPKGCTTKGTFIIDRIIFSHLPTYALVLSTENIAIENANLTLSPNPVNDLLTIRSSSRIEKVEIYNLLGQKVMTHNSDRIDVSNLSKGIYVSKVYLENDSISTKKFIKR